MTISERTIGDVTILDVVGRIALQDGAGDFRDAIRRVIHEGRVRLVLNLQGVPYVDSTALGEIIRAYTSVIRKGGSLKLLHVTSHVHQLFVITALLSVFDFFDAETEAVRSFGTPRQKEPSA